LRHQRLDDPLVLGPENLGYQRVNQPGESFLGREQPPHEHWLLKA
jgi:hypothetical protein